jgi:hypothetical protein
LEIFREAPAKRFYADRVDRRHHYLGILSAVALPKFIDLTNESLDAAVAGVAAQWRPVPR